MLIISVGGGKGGTGKTFIATSIAHHLARSGKKVLYVDADVESPVSHTLLGIDGREIVEEAKGFLPSINADRCVGCGICVEKCPAHALVGIKGTVPTLLENVCEGCGLCMIVCPRNAIKDRGRIIGRIYSGRKGLIDLIQGEVLPGVKEHINVVLRTINYAEEKFGEYDYVVIDSAPGTGAGVWLAIRRADIVVAVTEPTPLGAHDLDRFLALSKKLGKRVVVVINKAGMGGARDDLIGEVADKHGVEIIGRIPYSKEVLDAYIHGNSVTDLYPDSSVSKELNNFVSKLLRQARK